MLGKLHSWRGDHTRSKDWRHSGVGGLVSIEDLGKKPAKSPTAKAAKKKVPFLSLGRSTVTLKSLQADYDNENEALNSGPPIDLFSNIPASAGLTPTFARSETSRPASPITRPQTADPERASFARRRSKTTPVPHLTLDFTSKPLPLTLDFEHARQRSTSTNHSRNPSATLNAAAGASIVRPRTSQSMHSDASTRKRSNSGASRPVKTHNSLYSLTPACSPSDSRRPSLSGADIQKIAQTALAKTTSKSSITSAPRPRSNSRSDMINMSPPERPAPVPSPARSVLEEVSGTLSATIRELQDLQGEWDHPEEDIPPMPTRMSSLMYCMPTPPETTTKSAPPTQEYFPAMRTPSNEAVQAAEHSLPPSRTPSLTKSIAPSVRSIPRSERAPDAPSLGRMQSIQIAYEKSKSTAHKLGVENDTLKQQMKFLRERFAEIGDLKAEKETLEVALGESRKNLEASIGHLQTCKVDQQALQNNVTNMARRLEEANVQKVDVLEQNGELQGHVSVLQKMLNALRTEAEELRKRPEMSEVEELRTKMAKAEEENKLLAEQAKAAEGRADLPARVAELSFKLDDANRNNAEKDKVIAELEAQTSALTDDLSTVQEERASLAEIYAALKSQTTLKQNLSNKRVNAMNKQIEDIEKARTAALAESEKHLLLLKETLRRTANDVHKREHPASNLLEKKLNIDEAIAEIRLKFERKMVKLAEQEGKNEEQDAKNPATKIEELEKEIEYHVKDIVLYKLDVKGYRKDLKRAKEKIASLSEASTTTISSSPKTYEEKEVYTPKRQDSPTSRSDAESISPKTPSIATALHVQLPMRHIAHAYAAPMQGKGAMVST